MDGYIVAIVVLAILLGVQVWINREDRKRFMKREDMLYAAILAKTPNEYLAIHDSMKMEPKDKERMMQLENELAIKAAEIERSLEIGKGQKIVS